MITKGKSQSFFDEAETSEQSESSKLVNDGFGEMHISVSEGKTVADAVNKVVLLYSFARQGHVWDFINEFTRRPIATLVDIFGSQDLRFDNVIEHHEKWVVKKRIDRPATFARAAGIGVAPTGIMGTPNIGSSAIATAALQVPVYRRERVKKTWTTEEYKPVEGIEGFHSRAFGFKDNLFGLVHPKIRKILGLSKKDGDVAAKLDTRKEKRKAVINYLTSLMEGQGIAG